MKFEFLSIRIFIDKNLIKINLGNLWNLFDRIPNSTYCLRYVYLLKIFHKTNRKIVLHDRTSSIQRFNDQNETLILLSV